MYMYTYIHIHTRITRSFSLIRTAYHHSNTTRTRRNPPRTIEAGWGTTETTTTPQHDTLNNSSTKAKVMALSGIPRKEASLKEASVYRDLPRSSQPGIPPPPPRPVGGIMRPLPPSRPLSVLSSAVSATGINPNLAAAVNNATPYVLGPRVASSMSNGSYAPSTSSINYAAAAPRGGNNGGASLSPSSLNTASVTRGVLGAPRRDGTQPP